MPGNEMSEDKMSEGETAPPSAAPIPATLASEDLLRTVADPALTEDLALALLKRADLSAEVLEQLAKNANALKSRKVRIALASHPQHTTPCVGAAGAPVLHFRSDESCALAQLFQPT